jgi:hypothetical protein
MIFLSDVTSIDEKRIKRSGMNNMVCKGICIRHKALKPTGAGRYSTGQKRCQICDIFMDWDSLFCPCCGYRLRTKPRNLKYKTKLRKSTAVAAAAVAVKKGQQQELVLIEKRWQIYTAI